MIRVYCQFINILSFLIHNREIKEISSWREIHRLSIEQAVAGVVFDCIRERGREFGVPTEDILPWYALTCQIEQRNRKVNSVVCKVVQELNAHDISPILLKGQGLAQEYPNPLTRQSGDVDVYVGLKNYEAAQKIFVDKGWLVGNGLHEDYKHLKFAVDGVLVELHKYCAIIPGRRQNAYFQKLMEAALANSTSGFYMDDVFVRTFPLIENTIYTFIHAFFHFISEGGIVLRQIMDFSLLLKRLNREQDRSSFEMEFRTHLIKTGFLKPWQVFGCLLVKYLGFSVEEIPCYNAQYERKAEQVMEIIQEEGHKRCQKRRKKQNLAMGYLSKCVSHFRLIRLFPAECLGFLGRLLLNTSLKYVHIISKQITR